MTKSRIHQIAIGLEEELRKFDQEVLTMPTEPSATEFAEARAWQIERFLEKQIPQSN